MNISTFRDALKVLGERYWPKQNIHLAPVIRHPYSDSITDDMESALRSDQTALERVIAPAYLAAGNAEIISSQAQRLGCSFNLPFRETIFHVFVGPEHVNQTDSLSCVIDTGKSAFPDIVALGLFWKHLKDIAVVLSHRNGLQKSLSLWDLRTQRELTRGAVYDEAMFTLERMEEEHLAGFGEEQREQFQDFSDIVVATEMSRLRPLLFRIFDPARMFVRVRPLAQPGISSEALARRTHFEVMTQDQMTLACDGEAKDGSWIKRGVSYQVVETPGYLLPPPDQTWDGPPAFAIGKENADDRDWIFILPGVGTDKGRWGRLAASETPGDWRLTVAVDKEATTQVHDVQKVLVSKAVSELAALKLIHSGEMKTLTLTEEPLRRPRAFVMLEACAECLAAGRGKHATYSPVPIQLDVTPVELGQFFDRFRVRWAELRPDLMGGH